MSDITFYNQKGKPTAYTSDEEHIYLYSGRPVAYLSNDSIYSYSGKHLGRFGKGWIRDNRGKCVFFTPEASGSGPVKPIRGVLPVKGVKGVRPVKSVKQTRPSKPVDSLSWSALSSDAFFDQ
jgi:hypothetical protein